MNAIVLASLVMTASWASAFTMAHAAPPASPVKTETALRVGETLPDAAMVGDAGKPVRMAGKKGRVKIISVVPQLNTPVCDEQTHRFSEQNGGLDRSLEIMTLSTNSAEDQTRFARKAKIANITFLSDAPAFDFGKRTGLLLEMQGILHRAVIVADAQNIIRYVEMVPMGQLPNFEAAYAAARKVLGPAGN
jgi:thiol peroxidase